MILQEVEHTVLIRPDLLPLGSETAGRSLSPYDFLKSVIETALVIEVVKMSVIKVTTVVVRLIGLADEDKSRICLFHLGNAPVPEIHGHKLHHIAAEAPYSLCRPEEQ